ncbi:leucine-rich repeat-containing protein egg-6-like [Aethina tumida]|uniref:leucine-rich repeat-containing protein egg-6-like n=1 Tax=Aethina tumida TaxID=116153 RepID=UPI0021479104|nr:leucine-rich repeat-containing protein egg-6-like [Aethina tumida]
MSSIPSLYFTKYYYTQKLNLESLKILKIIPGAFNRLNNLKVLHLNKNNLTNLGDGIFNSLIYLEELYLEFNKIENITDHAFAGLNNLKILNLSENRLHQISQSINFLGNLQSIYIGNNFISIENLYNHRVKYLDLSSNNISSFQIDFGVTTIILNHNNINNISNSMFRYAHFLIHVDLSFNSLTSIDINTFDRNNSIETLKLNNNLLIKIPAGCFRMFVELKLLNLSNNCLKEIPVGEFDSLQQLTNLDLSGNLLKHMFDFTYLQIRSLNLRDNLLRDFYVNLKYMPHMTEIFISGNGWDCQNLINIIRDLNDRKVKFDTGRNYSGSNILGIPCDNNKYTKSDSIEQNAAQSKPPNSSTLLQYFNRDFFNSNFYKYFQSFTDKGLNYTDTIDSIKNSVQNIFKNNSISDYFQYGFLKSNFVKYLNSFKSGKNLSFPETEMYEFFDKKFNHTNFFKFLYSYKPEMDIEHINTTGELKSYNSIMLEILKNLTSREDNLEKYVQDELKSKNNIILIRNLTSEMRGLGGVALKQKSEDLQKDSIPVTNYITQGFIITILILLLLVQLYQVYQGKISTSSPELVELS